MDDGYKELFKIFTEKKDGHKPSDLSDLLGCPFCEGKATLIKKEDSYWPRDMVTCKNEECELTDWIPYDDWQRRAT